MKSNLNETLQINTRKKNGEEQKFFLQITFVLSPEKKVGNLSCVCLIYMVVLLEQSITGIV